MSKLDVASFAPTSARAVWFMDNDVTPMPISTHASNGACALSCFNGVIPGWTQ